MIGYLVTAADNINRPVALIGCDDDTDAKKLALAKRVARNIDADFDSAVYDLREYGKRDSLAAMPQFIYGLVLTEPDDHCFDHPPFFPYCRWRFAKLFKQHLAEWRPELGSPLDDVVFGYVGTGDDNFGDLSTLAIDLATATVMTDLTDEDSPRNLLALAK